jgi:Cysteine-rich secretory protein family
MEHKPIAIMILSVFVIGILMLGTLAATANAQGSSSTGTEHIGAVSGANQQSVLDIHNRERTAVGVPALVWSESLASDALSYLDKMVAENQGVVWDTPGGVELIRHDPALPSTTPPQGENLASFSRASSPDPPKAPSLERLVGGWVAEKSNIPSGFTGASYVIKPDIGHYTQMVWKNTKEVGCAAAIVRGMTIGNPGGEIPAVSSYLICRYSPPGNYINQLPYPGFR